MPFARPSLIATILRPLLLASLALGCNPSDRTLRADLERYLQRTADWAPVEAETARTIDRILATQFVDEAEVRRQVDADSPRVDAHLARIRAVQPTSPELQEIHRRYVAIWEDLARGYRDLIRGLDTGRVPEIAAGRAALEAWRTGIVDTARELRRLQQDVGS
jgi:hypothetical protein